MARLVVELDDELTRKVNLWRAERMPMPTLKTAIASLVERGLSVDASGQAWIEKS